jgi:hypothetical protein
MTMATNWPGPSATYFEVQAFLRAQVPPPSDPETPQHEAPPVENGPSILCNACGVIRVRLGKPICAGCMVHT